MALKSILFIFITLTVVFGSVLINPFIGMCGYILSYNINPTGFWWGRELPDIFQRYSLIFSLACFTGLFFHWSKLRFRQWFDRQEILFFLFICNIWMSVFMGVPTETIGENSMKMTKVFIILFLASHLITNLKYFRIMVWIYIIAALYSGFEIYSSESLIYRGGRLQTGIGGSDFSEGNFLAAHYLLVLPWIGINFLKENWKGKFICLASAAFVLNSIIHTGSRGAFLGIASGVSALLVFAGRAHRKKILLLLPLGIIGFLYLSDVSFWKRMGTIETDQTSMDSSAMGRIEAWQEAIAMFMDYPYGVGEGNFKTLIGSYNPLAEGRDTHNTFFRCLAELGLQGLTILLLMVFTAFQTLGRIRRQVNDNTPKGHEYSLQVLALRIGLIMYLVTTIFLSHTYVEEFYWVLMFPLFLKRCLENEEDVT